MSDAPRSTARPRAALPAEDPARPSHAVHYEFSDTHKEEFRALAASLSFVGVCTMLFGVMSGLFALGAVYAGYAVNGVGLLVSSGVFIASAWWTVSAGRALSSMVSTRGRDVERLMEAVGHLRRLFGFTRVAIIVAAVALVVVAGLIVWCTVLADKGGRCPVGWW